MSIFQGNIEDIKNDIKFSLFIINSYLIEEPANNSSDCKVYIDKFITKFDVIYKAENDSNNQQDLLKTFLENYVIHTGLTRCQNLDYIIDKLALIHIMVPDRMRNLVSTTTTTTTTTTTNTTTAAAAAAAAAAASAAAAAAAATNPVGYPINYQGQQITSQMPGEIAPSQIPEVKKLVKTMYNNRDFDKEIKDIQKGLDEFMKMVCLSTNKNPAPFEQQLHNIELFLITLKNFETVLTSSSNYKSIDKVNMEDITKQEVVKIKELDDVPEPDMKSTALLKELRENENVKAFKYIAVNNKTLYGEMIHSKNIINGNPIHISYAGLANSVTDNNQYSFNITGDPNLVKIDTQYDNYQYKIYEDASRFLEFDAKILEQTMKDTSSNEYKILTESDHMLKLFRYVSNRKIAKSKVQIFINLLSNKDVNLESLPFMKYLRSTLRGFKLMNVTDQLTKFFTFQTKNMTETNPDYNQIDFRNALTDFNSKPYYKDFFNGIVVKLTDDIINLKIDEKGMYKPL